jgi:excinuclease UvrABC nuclease subunit
VWRSVYCEWIPEDGCGWPCKWGEKLCFHAWDNTPVVYTFIASDVCDECCAHIQHILYIGSTGNFRTRFDQHAKEKHWFWRVTNIKIEVCRSRPEAYELERSLIEEHRPWFNVQWNNGEES